MRPWDLLVDAGMGLVSRLGRSLLTLAGILLGTASLTVTSGLAASAQANVAETFNSYQATQVTARTAALRSSLDSQGMRRLAQRPGVSGVGSFALYRDALGPVLDGRTRQTVANDVVAADDDSLRISEPALVSGTRFTRFHVDRGERVAVVGAAVAARLSAPDALSAPSIIIHNTAFVVVGVIEDSPRRPTELSEVIVPSSTAASLWGGPQSWEVIAVADRMSVQAVGEVTAATLDPAHPTSWTVSIPPSPEYLRRQVAKDLSGLYLALAGMSLLIGALAIGNTMSVSVLERTGEIGIRRSLGMTRTAVAWLLTLEAVFLGLCGGLVGGGIGALIVMVTDLVRGWPYRVAPWTLLASPGIGVVTGLIGGAYPAFRAAWLSPAKAVRQ